MPYLCRTGEEGPPHLSAQHRLQRSHAEGPHFANRQVTILLFLKLQKFFPMFILHM